MNMSWHTSYFLLSFLAIALSLHFWRKKPPNRYPPGPPRLPILGNFFSLPTTTPWIQFAKWGKKYEGLISPIVHHIYPSTVQHITSGSGPVIYLNLLGRPLIVLNTAKATTDLLERRGGKYADRPQLTMAGEIVGYNNMMILSPYDHVFREQRKLISATFGKEKVSCFRGFLEMQAIEFAHNLKSNSEENLLKTVRKYAGNIILRTTYGLDIKEDHLHHITTASECGEEFLNLAVPGRFLVDSLPLLRYIPSWLPLSPQRQAHKWRGTAAKVQTLPYNEAKRHVIDGTAKESLLSRIYVRQGNLKSEKELDFPMMTANLLIAGIDSIGMAIHSAIVSLMKYQDAQRRGQAEIDAIVGSGRLPLLKDRENLPYVAAFCREVLRFDITAPLGFIHVASSDDVYEDYHIPAGAMVISNIWAILHDPQNFQDPWEFKPERFLNKTDPGINLVELGFGYGRRQCPGKNLALDLLFITVATLMAVYDIRHIQSSEQPNLPSGTARRSEAFSYIMTPRSPEAATLLESARATAA